LAVPASLYGLTIAVPTMVDLAHDGALIYVAELGRGLMMLLLNYAVQLLFLAELWRVSQDREGSIEECKEATSLCLELGCVFLFESTVLMDIRKSLTILSLVWAAPGPRYKSVTEGASLAAGAYQGVRAYSPKTGAVLGADEGEGGRSSYFTRMYRKVRPSPSPGVKQWKLDGISNSFRLWSSLTVALPKLFIGTALAYLGGIYIERSVDQEAMVLNTLAVVFIADIDEILYRAFTSDAMKDNLEHMRTVELTLSNRKRFCMWFLSSVICPLLTIGAAGFIIVHSRASDCPDFVWSWQMLVPQF